MPASRRMRAGAVIPEWVLDLDDYCLQAIVTSALVARAQARRHDAAHRSQSRAMSLLRADFDVCPVGKPDKCITVSGALVDTGVERVFVPPEIFDVITNATDTEIGEIHGGAEARYSIGPGTIVYRGKRRTLDVARGEPGEEPIFGVMGLEAFGLALDLAARRADRRLAFRKTRKR